MWQIYNSLVRNKIQSFLKTIMRQKPVVSHARFKVLLIKISALHIKSLSTPIQPPCHSLLFFSGSFPVQNGDYLRSGIICGPGIICGTVRGSFADPYSTPFLTRQYLPPSGFFFLYRWKSGTVCKFNMADHFEVEKGEDLAFLNQQMPLSSIIPAVQEARKHRPPFVPSVGLPNVIRTPQELMVERVMENCAFKSILAGVRCRYK